MGLDGNSVQKFQVLVHARREQVVGAIKAVSATFLALYGAKDKVHAATVEQYALADVLHALRYTCMRRRTPCTSRGTISRGDGRLHAMTDDVLALTDGLHARRTVCTRRRTNYTRRGTACTWPGRRAHGDGLRAGADGRRARGDGLLGSATAGMHELTDDVHATTIRL
jgi:hypothetical protein